MRFWTSGLKSCLGTWASHTFLSQFSHLQNRKNGTYRVIVRIKWDGAYKHWTKTRSHPLGLSWWSSRLWAADAGGMGSTLGYDMRNLKDISESPGDVTPMLLNCLVHPSKLLPQVFCCEKNKFLIFSYFFLWDFFFLQLKTFIIAS